MKLENKIGNTSLHLNSFKSPSNRQLHPIKYPIRSISSLRMSSEYKEHGIIEHPSWFFKGGSRPESPFPDVQPTRLSFNHGPGSYETDLPTIVVKSPKLLSPAFMTTGRDNESPPHPTSSPRAKRMEKKKANHVITRAVDDNVVSYEAHNSESSSSANRLQTPFSHNIANNGNEIDEGWSDKGHKFTKATKGDDLYWLHPISPTGLYVLQKPVDMFYEVQLSGDSADIKYQIPKSPIRYGIMRSGTSRFVNIAEQEENKRQASEIYKLKQQTIEEEKIRKFRELTTSNLREKRRRYGLGKSHSQKKSLASESSISGSPHRTSSYMFMSGTSRLHTPNSKLLRKQLTNSSSTSTSTRSNTWSIQKESKKNWDIGEKQTFNRSKRGDFEVHLSRKSLREAGSIMKREAMKSHLRYIQGINSQEESSKCTTTTSNGDTEVSDSNVNKGKSVNTLKQQKDILSINDKMNEINLMTITSTQKEFHQAMQRDQRKDEAEKKLDVLFKASGHYLPA